MSTSAEQSEKAKTIPLPATKGENLNPRRFPTEEIDALMPPRANLDARYSSREEFAPFNDPINIKERIASSPTVNLASWQNYDNSTSSSQDRNQGQDFQQRKITSNPKGNNKTENVHGTKLETFLKIIKDLFRTAGSRIERLFLHAASIGVRDSRQKQAEKNLKENDETEKAQGTKLETFLKIRKDLLSKGGSPIERLFLHAASIAIFPIWCVAHVLNWCVARVLNLRKKNPGELKTDRSRGNRQNFRTKTQSQPANINVNINVINVHQQPLRELQSVSASRKIGWNSEGMGTAQTRGLTVRVKVGR